MAAVLTNPLAKSGASSVATKTGTNGVIETSGPSIASQNALASAKYSYGEAQETAYLLAHPDQIQTVTGGGFPSSLTGLPLIGQGLSLLNSAGGGLQGAEFGNGGGSATQQLQAAAANLGVTQSDVQAASSASNVTQVGATPAAFSSPIYSSAPVDSIGAAVSTAPVAAAGVTPVYAYVVGAVVVAVALGVGLWWALK
jgi:hypothetical protein